MMKYITACLLVTLLSAHSTPALEEVRTTYQKAASSEKSCKELIHLLNPYTEMNNTLLSGYKGSATMMMAKYVFSPVSKLNYFNKGKKILENAIEKDKKNVELRFLRYSIQTNIPFFLGYKGNIETDKNFLVASITKINDEALKTLVITYLKKYGELSEKEKQQI